MTPSIMKRTSTARGERGVAAVEAALVLPVLLLLVMGIIDLGRALATKQEVTHATREAVRVYAVTHDAGQAAAAFAAGTAGLTCSAPAISPTPCTEGEQVAVQATCAFDYVTPLAGRLSPISQIGSRAVMRCGG